MKDIPGYEGLYAITRDGKVWSYLSNKWLATNKRSKGYVKVALHINNKTKHHYIHRLVYITYVGEIPKGMEINHINEQRDDNRLENLQLCSHRENLMYGNRCKKHSESLKNSPRLLRGAKCNFAQPYKAINLKSKEEMLFGTRNEVLKFCNVSSSSFAYFLKNQRNIFSVNGVDYKIEKIGK